MDSQRAFVRGAASRGRSRVLVADRETHTAQLIATALRFAGFDTRLAAGPSAAVEIAAEFRPHLVLLDAAFADIDGRIRRHDRQIRVIFLADDSTDDLDDSIAKPFSLDDVVARCRAVLRSDELPTHSVLRFADLELDRERREVRRADNVIDLSPTEFAVLRLLLENKGRVLSRPQILAHVWTYDFHGDAAIVESYISFLRKKIDRFDPPLIHTLRGVGYSLRLGPTATSEGT